MAIETEANADEQAYVYFAAADYAGLWVRIFALVVDLAVLFIALFVLYTVVEWLYVFSIEWFLAVSGTIVILYQTALKRSRFRTPGYWLTDLRIVDLRGRTPSMLLMTARFAWWVFGPVNGLLDILFISNNDQRQTIRDKLVGTYVVKKDARPVGSGERVMRSFSFMGLMLMYPWVQPARADRHGRRTTVAHTR